MSRSLLILDRDGVINLDSDDYIKTLDEWIPIPSSIEAIARLSQAGWTVAVATNQSGIARGYYDLAVLEAMHARLRELVAGQGGEVGVVGFEIPFNRHFYVFQPPRPLEAIDRDLKACTDRIKQMIEGLSA